MFENKTKDVIHQEMLNSISDDYDKNVGSFIYDATRPSAEKLEEAYKDMDLVVSKLSINNLSGDELAKEVYERTGITRHKATYATTIVTVNGQPGTVINIGDKVSSDSINYTFMESKTIDVNGQALVLVQADVIGAIGNVPANTINSFPITLQGLTGVTNLYPVTNGYEAETDANLLDRYYERIQTPPTSGNKAHYKNWAKEVTGVGDARVFPLWNGDNTVKVVIIDSNKAPASADLVAAVQNYIDPGVTGLGEGVAPIGAFATVASAIGKSINIIVDAIKDPAFTDQQIQLNVEENLREYLSSIAFDENSTVSYARIGSLIIASEGILDYQNLLINNSTANVLIGEQEVAVLGGVTID